MMDSEKLIVLGCDNRNTLSSFLGKFKTKLLPDHRMIIAGRLTDLLDMVTSMQPSIVLLLFRNNQPVLEDLISFGRKPSMPIICISQNRDINTVTWPIRYSVFSCVWHEGDKKNELETLICSILVLLTPAPTGAHYGSLTSVHKSYGRIPVGNDLSRYILELDQKTDLLDKIKVRIAALYTNVDDPVRMELIGIVNKIKSLSNNKKLWDDFKTYFEETDPGFLNFLAIKYPELTSIDLKYCCYVKMNMSNDDIGSLLGINRESVRTHKYRLKRKMKLSKEQDLLRFLKSVEPKQYLFG